MTAGSNAEALSDQGRIVEERARVEVLRAERLEHRAHRAAVVIVGPPGEPGAIQGTIDVRHPQVAGHAGLVSRVLRSVVTVRQARVVDEDRAPSLWIVRAV